MVVRWGVIPGIPLTTWRNLQSATAPEGGEAMVDFILEVEELEERIAPGGYTGIGS